AIATALPFLGVDEIQSLRKLKGHHRLLERDGSRYAYPFRQYEKFSTFLRNELVSNNLDVRIGPSFSLGEDCISEELWDPKWVRFLVRRRTVETRALSIGVRARARTVLRCRFVVRPSELATKRPQRSAKLKRDACRVFSSGRGS